MNLVPITKSYRPLRLPAACQACGGDVNTDDGYADIHGEPFKAYLCAACARPHLAVKAQWVIERAGARYLVEASDSIVGGRIIRQL